MQTYRFKAEVQAEADGRWSAWIESLVGCAVWGYTRDEAMAELREAAEMYLVLMLDGGEAIPDDGADPGADTTIIATDECAYHGGVSTKMLYANPDGRRTLVCFRDDNDTLPPGVIEQLIRGTGWTEDDARRLGLI